MYSSNRLSFCPFVSLSTSRPTDLTDRSVVCIIDCTIDHSRQLIDQEIDRSINQSSSINHLFKAIVLPKIVRGLPVYGAFQTDLNAVQCFLNRCFQRRYSSKLHNIHQLLEECDKKLFKEITSVSSHPAYTSCPKPKCSPLD